MAAIAAIEAIHFTDPGCPWAYSASPAHAVLRWRYREQLRWRLVTIGLAEDPQRYVAAGYTPSRMASGYLTYRRRFGMPFAFEPRARVAATAPACRAIVATRLLHPGREHDALRALQRGWFTTTLALDEPEGLRTALGWVDGLDVEAVLGALDDPATLAAYEADRAETRQAEGGPTHFQGKARQTDGPVRYSAPSVIFAAPDGRRLEAGGFQPIEAYDVLIANLDTSLRREEPAPDALAALGAFPGGLATQEVAAVMAHNNQDPDRQRAERELYELLGEGAVVREAAGDDAIWRAA